MKHPLAALLLTLCWASGVCAEPPAWPALREHRLLVTVDPVDIGSRESDELVAGLDFDSQRLGIGRPDLSSMIIVQLDPETGQVVPRRASAYAELAGELPFQFYDEQVPWRFPGMEGYVNPQTGAALPMEIKQGTGRFFGSIGQGRRGRLVWPHVQTGKALSRYAIYFDALNDSAAPRALIPGLIGDGVNRCTDHPTSFAPVIHGRIGVGDLSGDGLFDMVLGNATGTVLYYQNSGQAGKPVFDAPQLLTMEDGSPLDVGWSSAPDLFDWDHDGLLDLITGAEKEAILFYKNVGTARQPRFKLVGPVLADGKPLRTPHQPCAEDPENKTYPVDYYPVPQVVDWNGDGKADLLAGGYITGVIFYYENTATSPSEMPVLSYRGMLQADGMELDTTWGAAPCAADFNTDGSLDLISGSMQISAGGGDMAASDKFLLFYQGGRPSVQRDLTNKPFPAKGRFGNGILATPRAVDFNADGLLDLVVSCMGEVWLIPNIGTPAEPLWDASTPPLRLKFGNAALGWVRFVDVNGDGWPDLFNGDSIRINQGIGSPGLFGKRIELAGAAKIDHPAPRGDKWDYRILADLDDDGQRDILIGDNDGHIWFHRNSGSVGAAQIDSAGEMLKITDGTEVKVGIQPKDAAAFDVLQEARTTFTAADFNRDGRLDLAIGDTYGKIRVFHQAATGGAAPTFAPPIEIAGPVPNVRLVVEDIDWDRDGWSDLLLAYANNRYYIALNVREQGSRPFGEPQEFAVPDCWGDPFVTVADWNNDGDEDLLIDQYGYTRFVERSFIQHGHVPAKVIGHETRKP